MKTLTSILQLLLIFGVSQNSIEAQNLLSPATQQQFVNPLPVPSVIDATNGGSFTISVSQFKQQLGLMDPQTHTPFLTTVWGYNGTYPGPTIVAKRDVPVDITWQNNLKKNNKLLPHLFPIDISIDWALSGRSDWRSLGVPIVTHLHGGHTESASDGLPEAWFTPDFAVTGPGFKKQKLHYNNDQEAATIWYHDHAMGITRLNVYAGLAGYYLITDNNEELLQKTHKLPSAPYDIGLAIQDRMFTADGQLFYPTEPPPSGSPDNSIMPEVFGDFILVNGKIWPYLEVEPRPYRFRLLNGSDSRFYNLFLSNGQHFTQIGTDGGLLEKPVDLTSMLMGTGERRDVIIDFSNYSGQTIILQNDAKTPYPMGTTVDPQTTGHVMAFKVTKPLNTGIPVAKVANNLRPHIVEVKTSLPARKLILAEGEDEFDRLKVMLGTFEDGVIGFDEPVTENITQGSTEIWEIYNETPDAHPIHLHMVQMQLLSRQAFSASVDMKTGKPTNVQLIGNPKPPKPEESGWKDTYVMNPHEVTRIIANFDLAGLYVWHCHILSHEDHEMMRPFLVQANETPKYNTATATKLTEATISDEVSIGLKVSPNPFNNQLAVQFTLKQASTVVVNIYDNKGALVKQLSNGKRNAGLQQFMVDGTSWSNGIYFCEVIINNQRMMRKLVLQK